MDYLGHTVSGQGVSMDKDKVQAVLDWPTPINIKQLSKTIDKKMILERLKLIISEIF